MQSVVQRIEANRFLASDQDVEALARDLQTLNDQAERARGAYLRILVALTVRDVGERKRRQKLTESQTKNHLQVFEAVAARCYAAVLRAITTSDIAPNDTLPQPEQQRRTLERNRRSNYARTAASAVRVYIAAGADVRDLDLSTFTKAQLRAKAEELRPTPQLSVRRLFNAATRDVESAVKELQALAQIDPLQATMLVHGLVEKLQDVEHHIQATAPPEELQRAA